MNFNREGYCHGKSGTEEEGERNDENSWQHEGLLSTVIVGDSRSIRSKWNYTELALNLQLIMNFQLRFRSVDGLSSCCEDIDRSSALVES